MNKTKKINIFAIYLGCVFLSGCWVRTPSIDSNYTNEIGGSFVLVRNIVIHESPFSNVSIDPTERRRAPSSWPLLCKIKKGENLQIHGLIKRLETDGFKIYYVCGVKKYNIRFDMDLSMRDCIGLQVFKYSD